MTEQQRNDDSEPLACGASQRQIARDLGCRATRCDGSWPTSTAQRAGVDAARQPRGPGCWTPTTTVLQELLARYPDLTGVRLFEELRAAWLYRQLHHRRLAPAGTAAPDHAPAGGPLRDRPRPAGADGLRDLRPRLHRGRPAPRPRFQLRAGLLAAAVPALRRGPGLRHHAARTRPRLRVLGRRGGHLPVRQHEGRGHRLRGRRAHLQPTLPGLRHPLRLPARPAGPGGRKPRGRWSGHSTMSRRNLLNGRTFRTLAHLNEVTAWWLAKVADVRVHARPRRRPWSCTPRNGRT